MAYLVRLVQASSGKGSSKKEKKYSARSHDPPASPAGQEVVKEARRCWFGVPYSLGRVSRSRVDCSGLTTQLYQKFDVSLPHDVEEQYGYGSRASKPAPGDLVFFKEHGRITPVGIATGSGTVIDASSYCNKVTETRIRFIEGYVGAKRLL